ncbi:MAG: 5'-nucleotidase, lipoprotein e(P4) family [Flavobacteriales bacterium]
MKHILPALLIVVLAFTSCQSPKEDIAKANDIEQTVEIPTREHSAQAVLWQQMAGEYAALTHQAYNLAAMQLEKELNLERDKSLPLAIITDIDETVVDNSPYNAQMILGDFEYSKETWKEWGMEKSAREVPGAVDFFNKVKEMGIEVFYVSNRFDHQLDETLENMQALGLPYVDAEHVILKTVTSGKQARRDAINESHEVVMLLGDNLSDFTDSFDKQGTERRAFLVDSLKQEFGNKFIVFPNPMYGDWETKGLYEGKYDWTSAERDSLRRVKLRGY